MHRFFLLQTTLDPGAPVDLTPIAHQLRTVLRLEPGDQILLLDGSGAAFPTQIQSLDRSQAWGRVLSREAVHTEPRRPLFIYQAMLKADKFEWILQKGTEIGVSGFAPVISRRTVVRPAEKVRRKFPRWQTILREAAEQSERGVIPRLDGPYDWPAVLGQGEGVRLLLYAAERERSVGLVQALAGIDPLTPVSLLLGPEGGFSPEEAEEAQAAGWRVASLGPRILRAETAALVAATLVLHQSGDLGSTGVENDSDDTTRK